MQSAEIALNELEPVVKKGRISNLEEEQQGRKAMIEVPDNGHTVWENME